MTQKPVISDDPLYLLLRDGKVEEFNRRRAGGEEPRLMSCDFSAMDLRELVADGLDMRDSAFHETDLRGVDLRGACLEGASLHGARIAGAYFPVTLEAAEIDLSLEHGTRLRYRNGG